MGEIHFEWDEAKNLSGKQAMKKEYDLSNMECRRNPYAKRLKKQITIRMGVDVLDYFKALAEEVVRQSEPGVRL